jgi:hypothetical protein
VALVSFASIADQGGPASFRGERNLTEPSLLLLDLLMVAIFAGLVGVLATMAGSRDPGRWGVRALVALGTAVVLAAAVSQLAHGTVWDSPLSDVVWWFDSLMLIETIVALALAVFLGIPGCELGVWQALLARRSPIDAPAAPLGCVIGLHALDAWEAARKHPTQQNDRGQRP